MKKSNASSRDMDNWINFEREKSNGGKKFPLFSETKKKIDECLCMFVQCGLCTVHCTWMRTFSGYVKLQFSKRLKLNCNSCICNSNLLKQHANSFMTISIVQPKANWEKTCIFFWLEKINSCSLFAQHPCDGNHSSISLSLSSFSYLFFISFYFEEILNKLLFLLLFFLSWFIMHCIHIQSWSRCR